MNGYVSTTSNQPSIGVAAKRTTSAIAASTANVAAWGNAIASAPATRAGAPAFRMNSRSTVRMQWRHLIALPMINHTNTIHKNPPTHVISTSEARRNLTQLHQYARGETTHQSRPQRAAATEGSHTVHEWCEIPLSTRFRSG